MATMSSNMVMKTKMRGGLSRLVTGESIFINEFTADGGAGEIGIAPGSQEIWSICTSTMRRCSTKLRIRGLIDECRRHCQVARFYQRLL